MKIPLKFTENLEITRVILLDPPQSRKRGQEEFFMDTGSPRSFIVPKTASNLDLPVSKFKFKDNVYIGGSKLKAATIEDVKVAIRAEDDEIFRGEFDFGVTEYHGKQAAAPDNILGMDFLSRFGMNLIVKTKQKREAFLDC